MSNYTKRSTMTFEKISSEKEEKIAADNVLEYLQKAYIAEGTRFIIDNMEARGWKFSGIEHRIYDNNNDVVYDSKLASENDFLPSTSKTKVLQTIAAYVREDGRTAEEKNAAKEISDRILKALSENS